MLGLQSKYMCPQISVFMIITVLKTNIREYYDKLR